MLKKTVLTLVAGFGLAASVSAVPQMDKLESDFKTLMEGLAQDVAPSLRLGALSGDLQGDATIDHFSFTLPGFGVSVTDGLGRILRPEHNNSDTWQFPLHLSDLINKNTNGSFEQLMIYPSMKVAAGFAWNSWDFTVSGMWLPDGALSGVVGLANTPALNGLNPKLSFGNLGFQVRKTLIQDSGWTVPAVSLGAGFVQTGSKLEVSLKSLDDLNFPAQKVSVNETLDMGGTIGFTTSASIFTVDLQASKHFIFFTPYVKLSGAYQNSTFNGTAALATKVVDDNGTPGVPGDDVTTTGSIDARPSVNVSDFAILTTTGFELNLFSFVFNVNVIADLSRAFADFGATRGNAFAINTGFRYAF